MPDPPKILHCSARSAPQPAQSLNALFPGASDFTDSAHAAEWVSAACRSGMVIAHAIAQSIITGRPMQTKTPIIGNEEKLMEVRLWQAVVVTTIQEWVSGPLRRKREAEEYLFKDERDFPLVCQSAGLDVGRLRSKLSRLKPSELLQASKLRKVWGTLLFQQ